ncbi:MAG: GntR family transcriptional regulator [Deltaproteobacteria bacterium]|nr:GntR family transcriptional regulator [Deltaproteobacteria bacterium]
MSAIAKATLSDQITRLLRESIVSGSLPAGAPLRQEKLSGRFGVSMGSLREALRTLHADGLVTMLPNRGAQVSKLSADEASEIFEIRTMLEIGVLELSMPLLSEKDLTAADKILNRMDTAKDTGRWAELNRQFHETLYRAARRPRIMEMIYNLHDNVERYMRLYLDAMHFQAASQDEHRAILAAIRDKRFAAAKKILRGHMGRAREQLVDYLTGK